MNLKHRLYNIHAGFTLLELLIVVAIIGLLTSIVLASLNGGRSKGNDAGIKTDLRNAISQGEVFFNTNTVAPNSYTSVCTNGAVGGANGVGSFVLAAARISGLSSYATNATGTLTTATCNDSVGAWAAEVPLKTSGQMWCVDSLGHSKQESVTIAAATVCA